MATRVHQSARAGKRIALAAAAALCIGCVLAPSPDAPESARTDPGGTEQPAMRETEPAPVDPRVPRGCSIVWSEARADSVLFCPDPRPPSIR